MNHLDKARTGIAGLDHVLNGGLPKDRLYVVEGNPGAGKTTLALQFLLEGVRQGERVLYVTLSETAEELFQVASSHGWSLKDVDLIELDALGERLQEESEYTIYHPSDVELGETTRRVRTEVERLKPARVALDSVSELKILSQTSARYRREILGLKQFFAGKQSTVLVLDDRTSSDGEQQLQSIAHGVISMERTTREYGATRRQLQIVKMRGVRFRDGLHDFSIRSGGLEVYPRLAFAPSEGVARAEQETVASGIAELDALLGTGLDRGTSTMLMGPAGSGKTTLCSQYILAAVRRGEVASCFLFEESRDTFLRRSAGLGMDFSSYVESGHLELHQVDPAELSPGEFSHSVRSAVEQRAARVILIDSLNGFLNVMPNERSLLIQLHEILMYLGQRNILTLLVIAQHGMMGGQMQSPVDVSFLADTVILLRYFEAMGAVRLAISVVKKRRGGHERTIREVRLSAGRISIGAPLRKFQGVLTGTPRYEGSNSPLFGQSDEQ